jgi:hypothetical protein
MRKRFIIWWQTRKRGGALSRVLARENRKERIKNLKKNMMHDLMVGHNIGDYTMQNADLEIFIKLDRNPPLSKLEELHLRYRGNDLNYRG